MRSNPEIQFLRDQQSCTNRIKMYVPPMSVEMAFPFEGQLEPWDDRLLSDISFKFEEHLSRMLEENMRELEHALRSQFNGNIQRIPTPRKTNNYEMVPYPAPLQVPQKKAPVWANAPAEVLI